MKEELGLDHFEGRSWRGLHRHALMTLIAYLFLQHLRSHAATGGKKKDRWTSTATEFAGHPALQAARFRRFAASPQGRRCRQGGLASRQLVPFSRSAVIQSR
jgi:hypothetical protein